MLKFIGLAIILNSLLFAFGFALFSNLHKGIIIFLCLISVFVGAFLFLNDRITEISINKIGTIKAAAEQATIDAKEITKIKGRIEAQSATVDLVAKQAAESKVLYEDLAQKNKEAGTKLNNIEEVLAGATKTSRDLQLLTGFTMTVIAAQNDDRKSFDQLNVWAKDKNYPLSSYANNARQAIIDRNAAFYMGNFTIPWQDDVDPLKLSFLELQSVYRSSGYLKPAILEFIWKKRNDIGKKEKMQFFIDVIQNDSSLNAVEYAGRYFNEGADLKYKPLAIELILDWWKVNKDKIQ